MEGRAGGEADADERVVGVRAIFFLCDGKLLFVEPHSYSAKMWMVSDNPGGMEVIIDSSI